MNVRHERLASYFKATIPITEKHINYARARGYTLTYMDDGTYKLFGNDEEEREAFIKILCDSDTKLDEFQSDFEEEESEIEEESDDDAILDRLGRLSYAAKPQTLTREQRIEYKIAHEKELLLKRLENQKTSSKPVNTKDDQEQNKRPRTNYRKKREEEERKRKEEAEKKKKFVPVSVPTTYWEELEVEVDVEKKAKHPASKTENNNQQNSQQNNNKTSENQSYNEKKLQKNPKTFNPSYHNNKRPNMEKFQLPPTVITALPDEDPEFYLEERQQKSENRNQTAFSTLHFILNENVPKRAPMRAPNRQQNAPHEETGPRYRNPKNQPVNLFDQENVQKVESRLEEKQKRIEEKIAEKNKQAEEKFQPYVVEEKKDKFAVYKPENNNQKQSKKEENKFAVYTAPKEQTTEQQKQQEQQQKKETKKEAKKKQKKEQEKSKEENKFAVYTAAKEEQEKTNDEKPKEENKFAVYTAPKEEKQKEEQKQKKQSKKEENKFAVYTAPKEEKQKEQPKKETKKQKKQKEQEKKKENKFAVYVPGREQQQQQKTNDNKFATYVPEKEQKQKTEKQKGEKKIDIKTIRKSVYYLFESYSPSLTDEQVLQTEEYSVKFTDYEPEGEATLFKSVNSILADYLIECFSIQPRMTNSTTKVPKSKPVTLPLLLPPSVIPVQFKYSDEDNVDISVFKTKQTSIETSKNLLEKALYRIKNDFIMWAYTFKKVSNEGTKPSEFAEMIKDYNSLVLSTHPPQRDVISFIVYVLTKIDKNEDENVEKIKNIYMEYFDRNKLLLCMHCHSAYIEGDGSICIEYYHPGMRIPLESGLMEKEIKMDGVTRKMVNYACCGTCFLDEPGCQQKLNLNHTEESEVSELLIDNQVF